MKPPSSIEAEQSVIGAILFDNRAYRRVADHVSHDDFYERLHQIIYMAIEALILQNTTASPVIVHEYLKESDAYKSVNGQSYLEACCANVPSIASAIDYAKLVRELRVRRDLKAVGESIIERAISSNIKDGPAIQIVEAQEALNKCAVNDVNYQEPAFIGKNSDDFFQECVENDGNLKGVSTGLNALDDSIGGLTPGSLMILAGRPSMGKTALALSLARSAIFANRQDGEKIGGHFSSMEMTRRELWPRMLSDVAYDLEAIPYQDISCGKFYRDQGDLLREANEAIKATPLIIDDARARTAAQIASSARHSRRRLEAKGIKLGFVMVDYLTLMRLDSAYAASPDMAIGNNCKAMKELAGELDCAVILLSQLNRQVENRDDKRPTMGDLRRSGEIEQDADIVGLVMRPEYYLARDSKAKDEDIADAKNVMKLFIDKNRQGPTTEINLFCDIRCNAVRDARPVEGDILSRAA